MKYTTSADSIQSSALLFHQGLQWKMFEKDWFPNISWINGRLSGHTPENLRRDIWMTTLHHISCIWGCFPAVCDPSDLKPLHAEQKLRGFWNWILSELEPWQNLPRLRESVAYSESKSYSRECLCVHSSRNTPSLLSLQPTQSTCVIFWDSEVLQTQQISICSYRIPALQIWDVRTGFDWTVRSAARGNDWETLFYVTQQDHGEGLHEWCMLGNGGLYVQQEYSAQFSSLLIKLYHIKRFIHWKYGQIKDNMKLCLWF